MNNLIKKFSKKDCERILHAIKETLPNQTLDEKRFYLQIKSKIEQHINQTWK